MPSVNLVLALVLLITMRLVGGRKGWQAFISLFINLNLLIVALLLLARGFSPFWITLVVSLSVSSVNLFYINHWNQKTKLAFVATFLTLALLVLAIHFFSERLMVQGFGKEELFEMDSLSLRFGINFLTLHTAVMVMATVAAINDTAMSITSAMQEVQRRNPAFSESQLFRSGLRIGREILGTTTNTLLFAFIGGNLALMIWLKDLDYSWVELINSKTVVAELANGLFSGLGVTLVIPLTAFLVAYQTKRKKRLPF